MQITRREVLKLGAMAGAGAFFSCRVRASRVRASPLPSVALRPFVDPLPIPPVLTPSSVVDVHIRQIRQKLHRDLPPTLVWGYDGTYLGPTFDVRRGTPTEVRWLNDLPSTHLLPIDHTIHGAESTLPDVRTVVHLHGAKVLADSDGYPEAWYTNGFGQTGPSFSRQVHHYPNDQAATMLWYHDHALGITRLNVYAGLSGVYLIRDAVEDALNLPGGTFEVPLVFQDRSINADGSLNYPVQGEGVPQTIPPIWVPEFFGDLGLVNGKIFPFLDVEPRKYRFRMLNASNARFLHLTLADSRNPLETLHFFQIGADQGFLPTPVELYDLLIGPAERHDVVIDFNGQQGKSFTLMNDAAAPFPSGGGVALPYLMQFRVSLPLSQPDHPLPSQLALVPLMDPDAADRRRQLLLAEMADPTTGDPIVTMLGTAADGALHWDSPVTEDPRVGSTEVWEFINTTSDAHPMHLHLVRFQVLDRQKFDLNLYLSTGEISLIGPPEAPAANERPAWKDTVIVYPGDPANGVGSLTRVIQRFELPSGASVPPGDMMQYVWHCHMLEHEDNEMMRPFNLMG